MSATGSHTATMTPRPYLEPGPLTAPAGEQQRPRRDVPGDPIELCKAAQRLLVLPASASADDLSPRRLAERNLRPARAILDAVLQRDRRPLTKERSLRDRVTGGSQIGSRRRTRERKTWA